MQISRRNALLGATAAAAVTGWPAIPLAQKAAGVKAALANADPEIEALFVQLAAADAHAEATGADDAWDRFNDIQAQIVVTPAMTLGGTLSKARMAWSITAACMDVDKTDPDFDPDTGRLNDERFIWSTLQDLERLAGEARS